MAIQFVQKDKGGTIYHDAVDTAPGRWDTGTAPTVVLLSRSGGQIVASQNATLGPSTTTNGAITAGASSLVATAVTGISVSDILVLGPNAGGQWEWVTVDSVNSSSKAVGTRDVIANSYDTGVALKSVRMSVTVTSAQASGIYESARAVWSFAFNSVSRTETSIFHISNWVPRMTLRDADVLIRQPRAVDLLGTRQRLIQLIIDVWERDIVEALGTMISPGRMLAGDPLRQAHLYKVLAEIETMSEDWEAAEAYLGHYQMAWERAISQTVVDLDGDGAVDDDDVPAAMMCGRIRRTA